MPIQSRWREARQIAETLLQSPVHLRRLPGGLVHFVYLAKTPDSSARAIVKIRGTRYAQVPSITCEPTAIEREAIALRLLNNVPALRDVVPRLLYADPTRGLLAMTEVAGCSLAEILKIRRVIPPGIAKSVGSLLGLCHATTMDFTPDPKDELFFEREIRLKLLLHCEPALDRVISIIRREPRAFVLGDRSPKNIIAGDTGKIFFIDFDNAHFGSRLFEMGYAAAHLLLHGAALGYNLALLQSEFQCAYESFARMPDESEYTACVAGALLYRLNNYVIPYQCQFTVATRRQITFALLNLLSRRRKLTISSLLATLDEAARTPVKNRLQ